MRRLVRGIMVAVLVGVIATGVSVAPALFIQSVFIGSAQRCEEQQRYEQAALGRVETTCEMELGEVPYWFPVLVIAVGGTVGTAGGFAYGFFARPPSRRRPMTPADLRRSTGSSATPDRPPSSTV